MCSDTANKPIISVCNLSKKYPIYGKKSDRLKEAFHPLRKKFHRDFWALKNVSFEVSGGETFGIILATVVALCNRVLLLEAGEAAFEGSPKDTINTYYRIRSGVSVNVPLPVPVETISSVNRPDETEDPRREKRYGSGKIVLDRYSINGNANCSEVFIKSGDLFEIELVHTVTAQVINPILGIKITTHNGIELYGNNSLFNKDSLGRLEPGRVITSKFTQTMDLNNGLYFLTVVSAELVNGEISYADRIVDMVLLRVSSGPFPYAGLCNMNGKIQYEIR
jgi:hypothetical protein